MSIRPIFLCASLVLVTTACGRDVDLGDQAADDGGTGDATDETSTSTSGETGDGSGDGTDADDSSGDTGETGMDELEPFEPGALIIPMDVDYQDFGMLEAYGLVYELLGNDISISWVIAGGKDLGGVDFTTSATDLRTDEVVDMHGYRGGPFVISSGMAADALPVIEAWQLANPDTTVHEATQGFDARVARRLLDAPTIAIFADGNEDIARDYLLAAKIPDSNGDPSWPDDSPDLLDPEEVAGPTDVAHDDGALFYGGDSPKYCQFMSMHWGIGEAEKNPEVVAEVRRYLGSDTHFFAECQAVSAFENLEPHGHFLTPGGLDLAEQPIAYDFFRMDTPFGQMDGPFVSVGGSEPAYSLPPGDAYFENDTVIISKADTPEGEQDVWMTGFLDGKCPASAQVCAGAGKISYLGGHRYDTKLPISENPETQGARLFLNSLFEAPCAVMGDAWPGYRPKR